MSNDIKTGEQTAVKQVSKLEKFIKEVKELICIMPDEKERFNYEPTYTYDAADIYIKGINVYDCDFRVLLENNITVIFSQDRGLRVFRK